ncbi:hypothetical protein SAMN02799622_00984 [Methylobacterium sp. UNC378MF]|nr:hypothetical protein SAMN02799622_00984 [Methylobacterium sp. UNC378MF]
MIVAAAGTVHVAVIMTVILVPVLAMVFVFVAVLMAVLMAVTMVMRVIGPVMIVAVIMVGMMIVAVIVPAGAVIVGGVLGPEGAGDRGRDAALPAHEFGRGRGSRDVEHVRADLGVHVAAAELPGQAQQADRILGAHLQEVLGGRLHRDETTVVEAQGVAVFQGRGLGERDVEGEPALPDQGSRNGVPGRAIEGHRIGDTVGAHRGPADDRGGCRHGILGRGAGYGSAVPRPERRLWTVA